MKLFGNIRILSTIVGMIMVLSACNNNGYQIPRAPQFPDLYHPTKATLVFPSKSGIEPLTLSIDNINMQIFNTSYLPYGTKLDSAYLKMSLSSETRVSIKNMLTGHIMNWSSNDSGKIDVSGGKLLIEVTRDVGKESKPLKYQLRLQTYGYNPNKFQWQKQKVSAPIESQESKVFMRGQEYYWIARLDSKIHLYEIKDIQAGNFTPIGGILPENLRVNTLTVDHKGGVWCLNDAGEVYHSADLMTWEMIETDGIQMTAIAYDLSKDDKSVKMSMVGMDESDHNYYTYSIEGTTVQQVTQLDQNFPVQDVFFFPYNVEGVLSAYAIGGTQANGSSVTNSFFTSNGINWAPLPTNFSNKDFRHPESGALYLRSDRTVYLIGGKYKDGISADMYISTDRGLNWKTIDKDKQPGEDFTPRIGVSGITMEENGDKVIYLIGGEINGQPSREIWKGFNDKTGGIINQTF